MRHERPNTPIKELCILRVECGCLCVRACVHRIEREFTTQTQMLTIWICRQHWGCFLVSSFYFRLPPLAPMLPFHVAYRSAFSRFVLSLWRLHCEFACTHGNAFPFFFCSFSSIRLIVIDGIISAIVRLAVLLPPPKTTTNSVFCAFSPAFLRVLCRR